jgi:hypothetical protein
MITENSSDSIGDSAMINAALSADVVCNAVKNA